LLFDRDRLERTVRDDLSEQTVYLQNVSYDRQGIASSPSQMVSDPRIFDDEHRESALAEHIDRYRDDFFFLKSDDFETESEYRVVLRTGDDADVGYRTDAEGYAYVGYGHALVAVVVGLEFPPWQWSCARTACAAAGVELRQMHWEGGHTPFLLTRQRRR
jgi:hypothetical protein